MSDFVGTATRVRYLVLAWLCALATVAYIHRSCLAVATTAIQDDLCLTAQQLAWAQAAFMLSYALFQLPSGWLGDRWGAWLGLTLCTVLSAAATGFMALAGGLVGLLLGRAIMGLAQAGLFPCAVQGIQRWFPETEKAMPCGLLGAFMSVGAVIGSSLTGLLLGYLSWPDVFLLLALTGPVCAGWFYWWFRDRPEEHSAVNAAELALLSRRPGEAVAQRPPEKTPWKALLTSPRLGLICGQQFFRAAGYIFYLTWFPTFLQKTCDVSVEAAGYWNSCPLLGVVVGSTLGGLVMDYLLRRTGSKQFSRQAIAVAGCLGSALCLILAYPQREALPTVALVTAGAFLAGLAGPAGYTVTIDLGGRHVATVFSTMNMAGNLGAFCTPVIAERVAHWWSWNEVLWYLAGLYVAAAICWCWLRIEGTLVEEIGDRPSAIGHRPGS